VTRAKPVYDTDGGWKHRQFSPQEWDALGARLRTKLRSFYPDKGAVEDPTFGHPADPWSNHLLSAAEGGLSLMLGLRLRLTNEQLRAEREDLLKTLNKAIESLSTVSRDLDVLFGVEADVLGTRDKIKELVPWIVASGVRIASLPKAKTRREAEHEAACEMALRVLRAIKGSGGAVAATGDTYLGYVSDAVQVLKIIGDELGLCLDASTWKKVVADTKKTAKDLR
jgi:hypothetical protein